MGTCASAHAGAGAAAETTAKVVLPDGRLLEYAGPVTASDVLPSHRSSSFLCCADDIEADGHLHAMPHGEELEIGQIYFVLPRSMLRRRIRPAEMAELALRASATLAVGGDPYGSCERRASDGGVERKGVEGRRRAGTGGGGRERKFIMELRAIPE